MSNPIRLLVLVTAALVFFGTTKVYARIGDYDWSLRKGVPFDPNHLPDPRIQGPIESDTIPEQCCISGIRVVTGFGLDVVTFEYRQVKFDRESKTWEWADNNVRRATILVYKYSNDDKKIIWDAPEGDRVANVADPEGAHNGRTNQVTVVELQPWERLSQIRVFSPKDESYPLSGIELYFVSLTGGTKAPKLIGGTQFDGSAPNTIIGKDNSEIVAIAIFYGHSLDAIGVCSRFLSNGTP